MLSTFKSSGWHWNDFHAVRQFHVAQNWQRHESTVVSSIDDTCDNTHNIQMSSPSHTKQIYWYKNDDVLVMMMLMLMLFSFTFCRRRDHPCPRTHTQTQYNEDVKVIKSDQLAGSAGGKLPSIRRQPEYVSVFENRCGTNVSKVRTSGR